MVHPVGLFEKVVARWVAPRRRRRLVEQTPAHFRILEIGPGFRPVFPKSRFPNARTLDHATRDELVRKYGADPSVGALVGQIEEVDYVWKSGPLHALFAPDERFDLVFSSHNLEHQTDLVSHLDSVRRLLVDDGAAVFFVPDYRRTFDALRYPSTASDALIAHQEQRQRHAGKAAFDSLAYSVEVNPGRTVRRGDFRAAVFSYTLDQAKSAFDARPDPDSAPYEDRHAWVFAPDSLEILLIELFLLGQITLVPDHVARAAGNEFYCRLVHAAQAERGVGGAAPLRAALEGRRKALFAARLPL